MSESASLILTLALAGPDQARFDRLREAYFPPGRNLIGAHVTLFHRLPGAERHAIEAKLAECCRQRDAFAVCVTGLRSLGAGTAFALASTELAGLRAELASAWAPWLIPQDRQGYRPHITVQNKVTAADARALLETLRAGFAPFSVEANGLLLWRYLGGPWELAGRFPFNPRSPATRR